MVPCVCDNKRSKLVICPCGGFKRLFAICDAVGEKGVKWGECPVGRDLSVDLAVVMTEYGCSSVSCVCGFLLKSLNDKFLGVDCLVASLYEQLGDSETGEHLD